MLSNLFKTLRRKPLFIQGPISKKPNVPVYDLEITKINGEKLSMAQFRGKKILIVNTASKCGFTGQYSELEKLHHQFSGKLEILGFPCNDFLFQEPKNNNEIAQFCELNYGISFVMSEKISIHSNQMHPIYKWLTDSKLNGWNSEKPSWNFCKYLINESGELVLYANSLIEPYDSRLIAEINK